MECERPEDVFAMEVVASLQGPPSPRPGVAAAVGDDDVPVVGQGVVTPVTVHTSLLLHHLYTPVQLLYT